MKICKISIFFFILCLCNLSVNSQNTIDLSGKWQFQIDRDDMGEQQRWFDKNLNDDIHLPGSMPEMDKGDKPCINTQWTASLYDSSFFFNPYMERFRKEDNYKVPFFLTPKRHFVGVAWYNKDVVIPSNWKSERVVLHLERAHIETTLWVNGKKAGMQNSLSVAHEYDITEFIKSGKNNISIRVDNRIKDVNVGMDSHSISDHTQGNWNGIVGDIALIVMPKVNFEDIQIFPDIENRRALVKLSINSDIKTNVTVSLSANSFNSQSIHDIDAITENIALDKGVSKHEITIDMGEGMLLWDEFTPNLYKLTAQLTKGKKTQIKEVQFGMREFKIKGKWFYVNGRKTHLRGNVDCCAFPQTGYPPMDVESWEKIYRLCKKSGLNHVRFHSYCPPRAAFIAADIVGIYLQPEGPSWPNHGPKLGLGEPIDKYLMDETIKLTKEYGNYPSYCMLAAGNEPAGNWVEWVSEFVKFWQKEDTRRVYTGASVGNSWKWQPDNEFHVKAGARGLNWKNTQPESMSDYSKNLENINEPYVAHEMGQWCVFPNFNEIRKYTGVNRAGNYEIFRSLLEDNNMGHKANDFMMASGKLQALCYKHEIEKALRTPDYAGFQLLGINDFPGQGTAIVGLLDVFFEERGYITYDQIRRFCSETVLLARMPKFTFKNNETFNAAIEVAHFGEKSLRNAVLNYTISDQYGKLYNEGECLIKDIPVGNCFSFTNISYDLKGIDKAVKLNLTVKLKGTDFINDWDFWVYPSCQQVNEGDVYIADSLDEKAIKVLEQGGKVLITAAGKITYGAGIGQMMSPVFWNTSWFKMKPPHTTGVLINNNHPVFKDFPTEYHSNIQWWELLNRAQVMLLSDFDKDFDPIVQSIDTWFLNRKIGTLIEANVLNGKLMMTSMDITNNPDNRIVACQLRKSIIDYMNSVHFRPDSKLSIEQVSSLFTKKTPDVNMFTNDSPDELKVGN